MPQPNIQNMLKQAQEVMAAQQEAQDALKEQKVEASAGGGMVSVRLSAKGDLKGVKIDESLYKPSEKEILEDLLVTAHNDARRKAELAMQEKMQALTGGLGLPPGLGLT